MRERNPKLKDVRPSASTMLQWFSKEITYGHNPGRTLSIVATAGGWAYRPKAAIVQPATEPTQTFQRWKEIRSWLSISGANVILPWPALRERRCAVRMGISCAKSAASWHTRSIPTYLVTSTRSIIAYLCPTPPARLPRGLRI